MVRQAVERHQAALQRYASQLVGGESFRAQSVVKSVLTTLGTQPAGEVGDDLMEWLFTHTRKTALAGAARDGLMKRFDEAGAGSAEDGTGETPHLMMQRLISRLTPKQQEALRLKFQHGFTLKEIARITELSAYSVGLLVHNAIVHLGRDFAAPEGAPLPPALSDDPRLTVYALGEMEPDERKRFESAQFDPKTAGLQVTEIRRLTTQITQTLAIEAGAAPPPARRRRSRRRALPAWLSSGRFWLGAVVLLALIGGGVAWMRSPAPADEVAAPRSTADFRLKPAHWKDPGPANAERGETVGGIGTGGATGSGAAGGSHAHATLSAGAQAHATSAAGSAPAQGGSGERASGPGAGSSAAPGAASGAAGEPAEADSVSVEANGASSPKAQHGPPHSANFASTETGPAQTAPRAIAQGRSEELAPPPPAAQAEGISSPTVQQAKTKADAPEVADPSSKPADSLGESHQPKSAARKAKASGPAASEGEDLPNQKFKSTALSAKSDLPTQVDTKSVALLKRTLGSGQWPAPSAVKVEALLNYFPTPYAPPKGRQPFAADLQATEAPWAPSHRLVRVGLKGHENTPPPRAPARLVFLVDVSGSMSAPNRLLLVAESVRRLLPHLRPDDEVGLVTFAGESRLSLLPTPVAQSREIIDALGRLSAGGDTNGEAGLELAYELAKSRTAPDGLNTLILCTDGGFNLGATTAEELTRIVDHYDNTGVALSVFGFGRGTKVDGRLEVLAQRGHGHSGYLNSERDAEQVLSQQVDGLLAPLAKDVQVEVDFNPEQVRSYRLLGYDAVPVTETAAPNSQGNSVLPGHALTALYEIEPAPGASTTVPGGANPAKLLTVRVGYTLPEGGARREDEFSLQDGGSRFAEAGADFRFAAAVAAFGEALRAGPEKGAAQLDQVEAWGRAALGDDAGGYRSEFLRLVAEAKAAAKR